MDSRAELVNYLDESTSHENDEAHAVLLVSPVRARCPLIENSAGCVRRRLSETVGSLRHANGSLMFTGCVDIQINPPSSRKPLKNAVPSQRLSLTRCICTSKLLFPGCTVSIIFHFHNFTFYIPALSAIQNQPVLLPVALSSWWTI